MDLGIPGKVAVVMGGSKAIGREICHELAAAGAHVAVIAREQAAIDRTVGEIVAAGGTARGFSADLSVLDNYDRVIAEVTEALGAPQIAVFNFATPALGSFDQVSEADFTRAFHECVLCYARMVKCVAPAMKARRWGRIVTIGSGTAKMPVRSDVFGYAVANTVRIAAVGLVKTIAFELAGHGITVNTIGTGAIETESPEWMSQPASVIGVPTEVFKQQFLGHIPVGRYGTTADMAGLCAYLCSERAGYTTGETILCDGGIANCVP